MTTNNSEKTNTIAVGKTINLSLIILLSLIETLDLMAVDMYLPAFSLVAEAFSATAGEVQQTLSISLIGLAIGQIIYGPILDRYGRRIPVLIGMSVFIFGSIYSALAPTINDLLVARFIQALGAAGGLVAPRAIVQDTCDLKSSARIFSILMQVMTIAPIVAPIMGAYLLIYGGWRINFWVLAFITFITFLWALKALPETLPKEKRTPLSVKNIIKANMLQCENLAFMTYSMSGGFIFGSIFVYISIAPFILMEFFNLTPLQYSYVFATNAIGMIIAGQISILALKHYSEKKIVGAAIFLNVLIGLCFLLSQLWGYNDFWTYLLFQWLSISTLGLTFGSLIALTMSHSGSQSGVASALMGFIQYLLPAIIGFTFSLLAPNLITLSLAFSLCGIFAGIFFWLGQKQQHGS